MSYEMIAVLMFSTMLVMMLTGQRVFGVIGFVAVVAALALWGTGGSNMGFSAAIKLMKWFPLLTLPMFIFMGYVMSESRLADDLYRMFHVWFEPVPGGLAIGTILAAPAGVRVQAPIKWRMQTYAGPSLGAEVARPAIEAFNTIANGQMEIELFYADQIVPTGELFRAMQSGTIDAVQSDDDSMASPTEVTVFGGYFPLGLRYSLDVPALFNKYGLKQIWEDEYAKVGVKHISAGAWDPCHFATKDPINSLADLQGKRVFTFPTAGRFLTRFGVVPVTLPWEDIEVAMQTGELDGIAWSGITEVYTVGWSNVTNYFLTNNISGAWIGHFFANMDSWNAVPPHLQKLLEVCFEQSHYYRQHWYWAGEADLRVNGPKLKLTSIPDEEWAQVETAASEFWDEIAAESEVKAKVVAIIKQYNDVQIKAGRPYRQG